MFLFAPVSAQGKNRKEARFAEKAEAVLFGIILVQAVSALLFPKD